MTITDEELRRFDALLCNGPLSRERGRDLVAELRQLTVQRSAYRAEADALRAENERLREARTQLSEYSPKALRDVDRDALIEELMTQESDRRLLRSQIRELKGDVAHWQGIANDRRKRSDAEAAELRASLADAVGRMERMEKVVAGVQAWCENGDDEKLLDRLDEYEASLPGLVKVEP